MATTPAPPAGTPSAAAFDATSLAVGATAPHGAVRRGADLARFDLSSTADPCTARYAAEAACDADAVTGGGDGDGEDASADERPGPPERDGESASDGERERWRERGGCERTRGVVVVR